MTDNRTIKYTFDVFGVSLGLIISWNRRFPPILDPNPVEDEREG